MAITNDNTPSTPRSSTSSVRSSASIETTVTKLLMSTKHLLQILTQWSKGAATGKMVSDSYVQLGNDFKLVSKFFSHAKVDVSDLGDVPMQLRKVLEVTLREPPSDDTLNKYLPSIREIIVNLLDKLKVKQAHLKAIRQDQPSARNSHIKNDSLSSVSPRSSMISTGAATNGKETPTTRRISNSQPEIAIRKSQTPKRDTIVSTIPPIDNGSPLEVPKIRNSTDQDALEQLKNGTNLQRRASKRYSAYHMAKLTNHSTSDAVTAAALATSPVPPTPMMFSVDQEIMSNQNTEVNESNTKRQSTRLFSEQKPDEDSTIEPTSAQKQYTVFLKLNGKTKKCTVPVITTMNGLRLLFVERFAYSPGGNSFPELYIIDPKYNVPYEFDEQDISTIKDGTVLELRTEPESSISKEILNEFMNTVKNEIQNSQTEILSHLQNNKTLVAESNNKLVNKTETTEHEAKPSSVAPKTNTSIDVSDIKRELSVIKQVYTSNREGIDGTIKDIKAKLEEFKNVSMAGSNFGGKDYVEKSQSSLGDISDNLLTRVDDLQDVIEILRKDVAERGSKPTKKKLDSVSSELKAAVSDLKKMEAYITSEKPHWKKIWETELDKVCEEQQFLNLQEDLLFDLNEDVNKALETYDLIHLCCDEQEKNPSKPRVNPILPILKPGTFNQVREEVMVAVQSLNPNHEERLDALEKAEKLWKKERVYKESDEFRDELGNFVEKSNLTKTGGVEEVERLRRQKDEENIRSTFKGNIQL